MKTKKMEKWLLLESSGELSLRRKRLLDVGPEAQAKRDELKALCEALPALEAEPAPWAAVKIVARLREERRLRLTFSRVWKPVFLTAACLTLVVSTFNFKQTAPVPVAVVATEMDVWDVQFEEDLVELESLIRTISDSSLEIVEM